MTCGAVGGVTTTGTTGSSPITAAVCGALTTGFPISMSNVSVSVRPLESVACTTTWKGFSDVSVVTERRVTRTLSIKPPRPGFVPGDLLRNSSCVRLLENSDRSTVIVEKSVDWLLRPSAVTSRITSPSQSTSIALVAASAPALGEKSNVSSYRLSSKVLMVRVIPFRPSSSICWVPCEAGPTAGWFSCTSMTLPVASNPEMLSKKSKRRELTSTSSNPANTTVCGVPMTVSVARSWVAAMLASEARKRNWPVSESIVAPPGALSNPKVTSVSLLAGCRSTSRFRVALASTV